MPLSREAMRQYQRDRRALKKVPDAVDRLEKLEERVSVLETQVVLEVPQTVKRVDPVLFKRVIAEKEARLRR
jgi:hypothetical protein